MWNKQQAGAAGGMSLTTMRIELDGSLEEGLMLISPKAFFDQQATVCMMIFSTKKKINPQKPMCSGICF